MTRMGAAYGYFDDTAARNNVPDAQSWRVLGGVAATGSGAAVVADVMARSPDRR